MQQSLTQTLTFYIFPRELNENIETTVKTKINNLLETNKQQPYGCVTKLLDITNISMSKIDYETCNCKVEAEISVNVIVPKYGLKVKGKVTEVTINGFYCTDKSGLLNIFVVSSRKYNIDDKVNVSLIKCKYENEKWTLIGKIE